MISSEALRRSNALPELALLFRAFMGLRPFFLYAAVLRMPYSSALISQILDMSRPRVKISPGRLDAPRSRPTALRHWWQALYSVHPNMICNAFAVGL